MDRKSMQDTALSAEVEPFVPGCTGKPMMSSYHHGQEYCKQFGGSQSAPNHMSQPPLTELPRYMTSCFPFVAEGSSNAANDARWQGHSQGHPPQGHSHQGHPPQGHPPQSFHSSYQPLNNANYFQQPPPVFTNTHPQQYPAQPHNFAGQYHEQNQTYGRRDSRDYAQFNGPAPGPPHPSYGPFVNQCPPPNPPVQVANYHSGYNNMSFGSKVGHYPLNNYHYTQNTFQPPVQRQAQRHKSWHGNMKNNAADWRKNVHMKNRQSTETKRPAKTLMMVDAALQTDFCPDIADKTLADLPSHLQNPHLTTRRKSQGQQTGNDMSTTQAVSADMDNDSGYYSPKHMHASTSTGVGLQQAAAVSVGLEKHAVFTPPQEGLFYPAYQQQQQHQQTSMPCVMPTPPQAFHGNPCQYNMPTVQCGMSYANALSQKAAYNLAAQGPRLPNHSIPKPVINPTGKRSSTTAQNHRTANGPKPKTEYGLGKGRAAYSNQSKSAGESEHIGYHGMKPPQLHDTSEYPGLPGVRRDQAESQAPKHSYSAIVKNKLTLQEHEAIESESRNESELIQPGEIIQPETLMSPDVVASGIKDGKNARKRRKKAIQAAKAAAREYSEITQEQKQLQENLKKPNRRTKMPIEFDLGDMLAALEKQQQDVRNNQEALAASKTTASSRTNTSEDSKALNPLDISGPRKRGKERENPVKKKPSALKKVILKEREEKKRQRALDENCLSDDGLGNESAGEIENINNADTSLGLSQEAVSERGSIISGLTCSQSDLSPVSQMSPMSLSPLSPGSPLSSGLSSPATSMNINSPSHVASKIHSRRFREYCNQVLDKDIDACCTTLLQALIKFQDRQYHKDPTKAKSKRRIVMGLREVTKHLKLKKIKCIIVSPNLEKIQAKGGLDDALENISSLAREQNVPLVFALGRKALGRAVNKLVPVSVVGLFNYDGAEETFQQLLQLSSKAREEYDDMIKKYQQDLEAANVARLTKRRHYMGHNRNLSGCSGISFSSVISEPISEDYPHPEPATDSRGNVLSSQENYDQMYPNKTNTWCPPKSVDSTHNSDDHKTATSKASSETLEPTAGEKDVAEVDDDDDDVNDEDDEDRNALYELEEIEGQDENELESEEETQRAPVEVPEDSTSDTRVAHWVVEAQSCFKDLSLKTSDDESAIATTIPQELVNS
ncbi:uncharacterized protein LOC117125035 [Anneissia japonica]|uniref:uncharacterized protein LOC117125035 n=1 Tax=Anneissia japonica TaxID=1529436 RepID=UPI00142579F2|nr:uncharacterized protein LOC117125035 [Anneissia japonica]